MKGRWKYALFLSLIGTSLFIWTTYVHGGGSGSNPRDVVAKVNGIPITWEEAFGEGTSDITDLGGANSADLYNDRLGRLEQVIADKLIEIEAAAKKKGKDEYLNEVVSQIKPPPDGVIRRFYELNKGMFAGQDFESAREQVKNVIMGIERKAAIDTLVRRLWRVADIDIFLEPKRFPLDLKYSMAVRKVRDTRVTLVGFIDPRSSDGKELLHTIKRLLDAYPVYVTFIAKAFYSGGDAIGANVGNALYCASEVGSYFDMAEWISGVDAPSSERLEAYGMEKGFGDGFTKCLKKGAHNDAVLKNLDEAKRLGITNGPVLFINGIMVQGVRPFSFYSHIIDDEFRRSM